LLYLEAQAALVASQLKNLSQSPHLYEELSNQK
jgi:hypothetical protein